MFDKIPEGLTARQNRYNELEIIVGGKTLEEALIETILMAEDIEGDVIYRCNKLEAKIEMIINLMVRMNGLREKP